MEKKKTYPSLSNLVEMGFSRGMVRDAYGNHSNLVENLREHSSKYFIDIDTLESPKIKKKSRYVITTAVTGQEACLKSIKSIESYCKKNDAEFLVLIAKGTDKVGQSLDKNLQNANIIIDDINLNNNVKLLTLLMNATKGDPTSGGITRIGKRDSSVILASSKQRLQYSATGIDKMPHAAMGTGSITKPNYPKKTVSGYVAQHDHVMGGIVVEVVDDELFHFRQIQFKDGRFVDLGVEYDGNKTKKVSGALVLGDWHSGSTCPVVAESSLSMSKQLGIKEWVMHDVFDGRSISHHNEGKLILKGVFAAQGKLSLNDELNGLKRDLEYIKMKIPKITIVRSNHDEHLSRYLDEGRFVTDPHNFRVGIHLATKLLSGDNPVEVGVEVDGINWLKRDQSYLVHGIECGAHGDKGANGSRGSAASLEKAYGDCVYGHSHSPNILRGAWCVGTSTLPFPDYGDGPTSWMNTHCIIYPGGFRQLVNCIEGKFFLAQK